MYVILSQKEVMLFINKANFNNNSNKVTNPNIESIYGENSYFVSQDWIKKVELENEFGLHQNINDSILDENWDKKI